MTVSPYHASRLVLQAKLFTAAKSLGAIVALAYQFLLVRHLSVNDYVSFTVLTAANGILVFATMFGMDRLVYRYVPPLRESGRWREMFLLFGSLLLLRQLAIAALLFVLGFLTLELLPKQIASEVTRLPWHYVWYAVAVGFSDSLSTFCNSLGRQGRQAMYLLVMTTLRFALSALAIWHYGNLDAVMIGDILVGTEFLLVAALLVTLLAEIRALAPKASGGPLHFGFDWRRMIWESLSTQMTYMLTLPFRGGVMKLIVGAVATPVVTASFGFFQTIADRAYQFMPAFMMKGIVEPALANGYARNQDLSRVRLTASLLIRLNVVILALGLAVLIGCGGPLIDFATRDRYGTEVGIAALLLVQMAALTIGEALWIVLNPVGRIVHHNKVWVWISILGYGLLAVGAALRNPEVLIIASALPYFAVYAWLRWLTRETVLQEGMGFGWLVHLLLPVLISAGVGRALVWLIGANSIGALVATAAVAICFIAILRTRNLITRNEAAEVNATSPKLARLLKLISAGK
ncbi:hypothetical protein [Massilia sp. METH4]|uniref:lipopolysaccharide biosynthesis protein n=1 Tax=Massilia sp. METH4 TaxID=3123041 RepID=UPI0030D5EDFF